MSIPVARARLEELAERAPTEIGVEILDIIPLLYRASPIRRVGRQSERLTDQLRQKIKDYASAYPEATFHEIATHHNVSIGRVSETLNDVYRTRKATH